MIAALLCLLGLRRHTPVRQLLGGWRCALCGFPGADLSEFGHDGYVNPMRRLFDRERHTRTTTSAWEPTRKRGW